MGCEVILAPRAVRDLESIVRYISATDPQTALHFGKTLVQKAEAVGAFPESGRVVPELGDTTVREVFYGSYRIVYRVRYPEQIIEIARFWHAAQGEPRI